MAQEWWPICPMVAENGTVSETLAGTETFLGICRSNDHGKAIGMANVADNHWVRDGDGEKSESESGLHA